MKTLGWILCLGVGCLLFAGCSNSITTGSSEAGSGPSKDTSASEAERAAADWLYPGAKAIHSGHGGAVSCVVQETADDVAKHTAGRAFRIRSIPRPAWRLAAGL